MENYNPQMNYEQMEMMNKVQNQSTAKVKEFKTRLEAFNNVSTLDEAKELAKNIMPVSLDINHFRIGDAKCVIINKPDIFRISIDTAEEFISYDFS